MEHRTVSASANGTISTLGRIRPSVHVPYLVFRVEIGAEFEKRARDVTVMVSACVMERRFSGFLDEFHSQTTRNIGCSDHCPPLFAPQKENKANLVSYVEILVDLQKQLHDRQTTKIGRPVKWDSSILVTSPHHPHSNTCVRSSYNHRQF
jgi:hypothetical protein